MTRLRMLIVSALVASCAANDPQQTTFPQQPVEQSGPPGGQMDPQYAYQGPQYGAPPSQPPSVNVNVEAQFDQTAPQQGDGEQPQQPDQSAEPSTDPQDPGYVMGDVDDSEIDQTLAPYGQWEDDDGQRVWVPDTTAVGMDFMPYDSAGSWVWSDAGWAFNCDYGWGWLPFHYGRWGWFHNHWGWVAGHQWGPGWVDWRRGNGLVGWRPMAPGAGRFEMHDAHWNFVHENQLGVGHIAGHLTVSAAEGLRGTQGVARLPTRGNYAPVASASLMRGRLETHDVHVNGGVRSQSAIRSQSANRSQQQTYRPQQQQSYRAQQQPSYHAPQQSYRAPQQSYRAPSRSYGGPARAY